MTKNMNSDEMFEAIIKSIKNTPHQIQRMINCIVDLQDEFPMPKAGWEAFIKDIDYTNKKRGINLQVPRSEDDQTKT